MQVTRLLWHAAPHEQTHGSFPPLPALTTGTAPSNLHPPSSTLCRGWMWLGLHVWDVSTLFSPSEGPLRSCTGASRDRAHPGRDSVSTWDFGWDHTDAVHGRAGGLTAWPAWSHQPEPTETSFPRDKPNPRQPLTHWTPPERSPKSVREEPEHTQAGFSFVWPGDQTQIASEHAATSQSRFRLSQIAEVRFQSLYTQCRWVPKGNLNSARLAAWFKSHFQLNPVLIQDNIQITRKTC